MTTVSQDENQMMDQVIARLAHHNPGISLSRISAIVHEEHHRFDGRPIRDFMSVLVERSAKGRLLR
ncbi:MAG: hypothetical protein H7201_18890 [Candidatus Saccharibacteria bacterium]|nr:hypothetical protein [Microbacteriaceae bacterium]